MALSAQEIARELAELKPALEGAVLVEVVELPEFAVVLYFQRPDGSVVRLLVSANDRFSRLHTVPWRIKHPKPPLPFGALLDNRLAGKRLVRIVQKLMDRVVRFEFEDGRQLIAELTGVHANLFLLNSEDRLEGMLRRNRSQVRKLAVGERYEPVFTKPSEAAAVHSSLPREVLDAASSFDEAVREYYTRQEQEFELNKAIAALRRGIVQRVRRVERSLKRAHDDFVKAQSLAKRRNLADLLAANFHRLRRGMKEIELTDFESDAPVKISLDPELAPHENLERLYAQARRGQRGVVRAQERIKTLEAELEQFKHLFDEFEAQKETWKSPQEVVQWAINKGFAELAEQLARRGERARIREKLRAKLKDEQAFRRFKSSSGLPILVGKNAKANDKLTFSVLKSEDYWFHITGGSGAHVGVRLPKGKSEIDPTTLKEAAAIAAKFSGYQEGQEAEVMYCKRKYVRPAGKRAGKGEVLVSHPKYIKVVLTPELLRPILERNDE